MAFGVGRSFALLLAPALGACTIVNVGPGDRVTMIRPGVLQIAPAPGAATLAYRTRGLGLVPGRSGPVLGWAREDAVLLYEPSQCRIVVLGPTISPAVAAFWAGLLKDHPDICQVGGKP